MHDLEVLIPITAILMPLFLVPTIIAMKQAGRKREMAHRERMRAMEQGRLPATARGSQGWAALTCIAIGLGVPVASLMMAVSTTAGLHRIDPTVWSTSALVGLAGVIAGATLALRTLGDRAADAVATGHDSAWSKPSYDPDALDVVGRRG